MSAFGKWAEGHGPLHSCKRENQLTPLSALCFIALKRSNHMFMVLWVMDHYLMELDQLQRLCYAMQYPSGAKQWQSMYC